MSARGANPGGLIERARAALERVLGSDASAIELHTRGDELTLAGTVDDETARVRALDAVRVAAGASRVQDRLALKPDWGEEAEAKRTEFGSVEATRAMLSDGFDKLV
jgi:hypothetical protein